MSSRHLALSSALRTCSRAPASTSVKAPLRTARLSTASRTAVASRSLAYTQTSPATSTGPKRPQATISRTTTVTHSATAGVRWSSESATGSTIWTFEEIQDLTNSPSSTNKPQAKAILIDTREPGELKQTGRIPGSVNVPITTSPDSFHIPADEFEDRFGFERPAPGTDVELVFYCKAGVRSRAAAAIARDAGWKRVGEYPGSWVEWSGKGGKVER
ncbi:Uu.00g023700.m01.CDS01 [Anthostomella pinea]|uniref:Sulfurtransferase n=1 Tax=Anthostomella pinea TaxID=933095 RepID=A0AAI8W033_9PEZI|nr:Uu.00g023700.m01.CDS01 [Anthostomella pinea]